MFYFNFPYFCMSPDEMNGRCLFNTKILLIGTGVNKGTLR